MKLNPLGPPREGVKAGEGNAKPKPDESSSTLDDSPGSGIAFLPVEVQTIGVEEMAVIFRKQERSILRDISQAPDRLPPLKAAWNTQAALAGNHRCNLAGRASRLRRHLCWRSHLSLGSFPR